MGTFDILNMRINGYDFHVSLMAGEEDWTSDQVKEVFAQWTTLLPYYQEGPNGRTWQEAAQSLKAHETGMYMLGTFVSEQFADNLDDLDFFAYPALNDEFGTDSIDAPIDGFMMAAEPENAEAAKEVLRYLGTPEAAIVFLTENPGSVAANSDADTSGYTPLQVKSAELIGATANIAQFLDRDTNPEFASNVMVDALTDFLADPSSIDSILTTSRSASRSSSSHERTEPVAAAPRRRRPADRAQRRTRCSPSATASSWSMLVAIPTLIHVVFVWVPAISTIVLSFTDWNGIAAVSDIRFVGFRNYWEIFTVFESDFLDAAINNGVLIVFLFLGPTVVGILLAYLLDKNLRGGRDLPEHLLPPGRAVARRRRVHLEERDVLAEPGLSSRRCSGELILATRSTGSVIRPS